MRERKRMHDLNVAMNNLCEVMPYANGSSVRKLSKIATLSLARNYIQMLTKSEEEMKQILDKIYRNNVHTRMQSQSEGFQTSLPHKPYIPTASVGTLMQIYVRKNMVTRGEYELSVPNSEIVGCCWIIQAIGCRINTSQ